ncbi:MAG: 50S ribosomal protein P1 [Candidatus Diapherotrites archaeon]|nr:50S ribosomal protein P1 [Candidatus Diapherotrites archaeon]
MEYIYSALLLHSAKKDISEKGVSEILKAAGIQADSTKIKGLLSALKDVNIEEAIQKAAVPVAAAPSSADAGKDDKAEEKKAEEEAKSEEAAAEGLGSLFG